MMRVAHVVDLYPQPELDFVHAQVRQDAQRRDILLAESLLRGPGLVPAEIPILAVRRVGAAGPFSAHRGWERVYRKLADTVGWTFRCARLRRVAMPLLREHDASVIHAHFGTVGARVVDLAAHAKLPLVVTFYGADASQVLRQPKWIDRYRALFDRAGLVIVLCEAVKRRLVERGCPERILQVWDIGLELGPFGYHARAVSTPRRILCVARFAEKKGHRILLKAFRAILATRPETTLTLMGYGPLKAELARLVDDVALAGKVRVVDTEGRDDFRQLFVEALHEHDIFALASTTAKDGDDEGGPALTAVYAQATGMPVVTSDFVGVERSVRHEVTGLIAKPDDPTDLAANLSRVLADPALAGALGCAGSTLVHENFSLPSQLAKLEDMYRALLAA